jgi:predicted phosphodiesterase
MVQTVAVLSDIHGMLVALDQVLAEPAVEAADLVVVTGDHTWGPQPTEVLDRLTSLGDRVVLIRGNADRELLMMSRARMSGSPPIRSRSGVPRSYRGHISNFSTRCPRP